MSPRRLVGLYPAAWRDRYGEEFLALLEESRPTGIAIVDIVWGAIDAHLFPQAPEGRFRMFTRLAGLAALGVGLILVLGAFNIGFGNPEQNAMRVSAIYALACIGLAGIHLRQVAVRPPLAWLGFVACALGLGTGAIAFALGLAGALPRQAGRLGSMPTSRCGWVPPCSGPPCSRSACFHGRLGWHSRSGRHSP